MKIIGKVLALVLLALSAHAQREIQLGPLVLGGNACRLGGAGPLNVTIEDGLLQIPAASLVRKEATETLERGTCQFTLPVQLAEGYRLVLKNLSAIGDLNLARGTTSRIDLEIFEAGSSGPRLTNLDGSSVRRVRKTINLKQDGEILVSDCGASFNLRGNSSVLLQGQSSMRSTGALHLIEMSAEIEKCH